MSDGMRSGGPASKQVGLSPIQPATPIPARPSDRPAPVHPSNAGIPLERRVLQRRNPAQPDATVTVSTTGRPHLSLAEYPNPAQPHRRLTVMTGRTCGCVALKMVDAARPMAAERPRRQSATSDADPLSPACSSIRGLRPGCGVSAAPGAISSPRSSLSCWTFLSCATFRSSGIVCPFRSVRPLPPTMVVPVPLDSDTGLMSATAGRCSCREGDGDRFGRLWPDGTTAMATGSGHHTHTREHHWAVPRCHEYRVPDPALANTSRPVSD